VARRRRLYAAVAERVRRLRKRHECVWHWSEHRPGEVEVLLITGRRRRGADAEFWGASGRSLHFRKARGRWVLVGEGCWRT
jgi:hypothetical protein